MSANGISTLSTKELKQKSKLELAKTKRQATGTNGFRDRNTYDITELPTQYDDNNVVNNPNSSGLQQGRPWN